MGVNNLPKVVTWQCSGRGSNLRPLSYKSKALLLDYQDTIPVIPSKSTQKNKATNLIVSSKRCCSNATGNADAKSRARRFHDMHHNFFFHIFPFSFSHISTFSIHLRLSTIGWNFDKAQTRWSGSWFCVICGCLTRWFILTITWQISILQFIQQ